MSYHFDTDGLDVDILNVLLSHVLVRVVGLPTSVEVLDQRHNGVDSLGTPGAIQIVRHTQQMVLQRLRTIKSLAAAHRTYKITRTHREKTPKNKTYFANWTRSLLFRTTVSSFFFFFSKRNKLILFFFLHSNFRRKKTIKRWIKNKRRYFGRGLCATCAATLFHSRGHRRRMGFSSRLRDSSHHMCNDWFDVPGWIKVLSRQRTIGDELQRKQMPSTTIMKLVSLGKWMKTRRRHCFGLADLLR